MHIGRHPLWNRAEVSGSAPVARARRGGPKEHLLAELDAGLAFVVAGLRGAWRRPFAWLFAFLIAACAVATFIFYDGFLNFFLAGSFSWTGYVRPWLLVPQFGINLLWLSHVAVVLLTAEVVHGDDQPRSADVVATRPTSTFLFLAGRLAGIVVTGWAPLALSLCLVQAFGYVSRLAGWWLGDTIEPLSLVVFLLLDAAPSLVLWTSIVMLLAVRSPSWLFTVVCGLVILAIATVSIPHVPVYLLTALLPVSDYVTFASDLAPNTPAPSTLLQRASILLLGAAFLLTAAFFHPRPDDESGRPRLAVAVAMAFLGSLGIALLVISANMGLDLRVKWLSEHARANSEPVSGAGIEQLKGQVRIDPNRGLDWDLQAVIAAPPTADASILTFSLNPGMRVVSLQMEGIRRYHHEDGLLVIEFAENMPAGSHRSMALRARGTPDPRFAYLDSTIDPLRLRNSNRIWRLGTEASIFEPTYVALTPSVHWLPTIGANIGRDDPNQTVRDYFELDLRVEVPAGWLVAGPGRRNTTANSEFLFRPSAPVSDVALFAAHFDRRAVQVDGVELEFLVSPEHSINSARFAEDKDAIARQLQRLLADAKSFGLPYPYKALTVVEVPARMRSYRGGQRLDSSLAFPGVLPLKETATRIRLERWLASITGTDDRSSVLFALGNSDSHGGFLFRGFARNLLGTLATPYGEHATAIEMLCDNLATKLLVYPFEHMQFTAHNFDQESRLGGLVGEMIVSAPRRNRHSIVSIVTPNVDQPDAWETLPLPSAELGSDPKRAMSAIRLRNLQISRAMFDVLGPIGTAKLLNEIRHRHAGGTFSVDQFLLAGSKVDPAFMRLIATWIQGGPLPGFLASEAVVTRMADDESGGHRYHTRLHIRNDEPETPGLVFVGLDRSSYDETRALTEPFVIEPRTSVEVVAVSPEAPRQLWLHSYLALNRRPVLISQSLASRDRSAVESFAGVRASSWLPSRPNVIVVDDLDPGFSVATTPNAENIGGFWWNRYGPQVAFDAGLPEFRRMSSRPRPGEWYRESAPWAWGKYRHTLVLASGGDGTRAVAFKAVLPATGRWELDYHLPIRPEDPDGLRGRERSHLDYLGTYEIVLRSRDLEQQVEFDGNAADPGWNKLGTFELRDGPTSIEITSRTDGDIVVADAIRWTPQYADP